MAERFINLRQWEVRAILAGRKTRLTRVYKPKAGFPRIDGEVTPTSADQWTEWGPCPLGVPGDTLWVRETWCELLHTSPATDEPILCEGDKLIEHATRRDDGRWNYDGKVIAYRATSDVEFCDGDGFSGEMANRDDMPRWRPSIHMPRWASRLTLAVKAVRVERLQDIGEHDALAEGVAGWVHDERCETARDGFRVLWDSINAKRREPSHIANRRRKGKATQRYDASHPEQPTPCEWASNPWVWVVEFEKEAGRG